MAPADEMTPERVADVLLEQEMEWCREAAGRQTVRADAAAGRWLVRFGSGSREDPRRANPQGLPEKAARLPAECGGVAPFIEDCKDRRAGARHARRHDSFAPPDPFLHGREEDVFAEDRRFEIVANDRPTDVVRGGSRLDPRPRLVGPRSCNTERGLEQEHRRVPPEGHRFEDFPASAADSRHRAQEPRHVGSDVRGKFPDLCAAQPRATQRIEPPQNRRGISGSPAHAGPGGNPLDQMDLRPAAGACRAEKRPRRHVGQIGLIAGQPWHIAGHGHPALRAEDNPDLIVESNRHHEGFDLVVPVRPPAKHPQVQIDFGMGGGLHWVYPVRMPGDANQKIIVALDVPAADDAARLMDALEGEVVRVKIGLRLFTAAGPPVVRKALDRGLGVFLDLKFHDIPNTVAEAVASARSLGVSMATIHLAGGPAMVAAAASQAGDMLLLGVTVLTSMDAGELAATGTSRGPQDQVVLLAQMGTAAGVRGLVASPREIASLRAACGPDIAIVTPGVRPAGSPASDQRRTATPADAIRDGADFLVVGRPVIAARDPREAFRAIAREISSSCG
jgi:orotidine-5'-phosphate decarboxylase